MNKTQLVECVALEANVTKKVASETVEALLTVVGKALAEGDSVKITGFGNFLVKERKEQINKMIEDSGLAKVTMTGIHSALTDFKGVKTESEGEEPNRHIVIKPL